MNNKKRFILTYGLFLAWLLSFIFNGPLFNILIESKKYGSTIFQIALLIVPQIIMLPIIIIKRPITPINNHIPVSIIMCLAGTIIIWIFGNNVHNIIQYMFTMMGAIISGCGALLFIYSTAVSFTKYDSVDNTFKLMAFIILIANILYNICELLIKYNLTMISELLIVFELIVALYLSFTFKDKKDFERPEYKIHINKKAVFLICLIFFLLNIGGGIIFEIIEPILIKSYSFADCYYILPYIVATIAVINILKRNRLSLDILLLFATILIIIGFFFFLQLDNRPIILVSNFFIQSGYAILDIFMWGMVAKMVYVYDRYYEISAYTMSCNVTAVLIGRVVSKIIIAYNANIQLIIFIGLLGILISIVLIPYLSKITIKDLNDGIEKLNQEIENQNNAGLLKNQVVLTEREKEIFDLLVSNLTNKEIAEKLFISDNTLKTHAKNIYSKMNVSGKKQLKELVNCVK